MGNQLCEATQQASYKFRITEICNGVDTNEAKTKLEPITFSDQGSVRDDKEKVYKDDDQIRQNTIDQFAITNEEFSPVRKDRPQVSPFTAENFRQQEKQNKDNQAVSYSSDFFSQSPTIKKAKLNMNQVYMKHMNSQHEEGNLDYKPMPVPFSVIKMVLNKQLITFIQQEKQKFFKLHQKDDQSFKLYKEGCYGRLISENSGIFLNNNYFYQGSFILKQNGEFLPENHGIYITEEGKYVGNFKQGKPQGKGKYIQFFGDDFHRRTVYIGEWQNGSLVNGTVENHQFKYEGELKNRKPHGVGKLVMKLSKISYKGQFQDGKYHGQKGFYETSEYTYSGDFLNGKKHGRGVLSQKASALQAFNKKLRKQERYEGKWIQDRLEERILTSINAS